MSGADARGGAARKDRLMRGMDGLTLGERIRRLRRASGRKQIAMARSSEVHNNEWCRWENDQIVPSLYRFAAIADCLGVTMDFLYWGEDKAARAAGDAGR